METLRKQKDKKCTVCHCYICVCQQMAISKFMPILFQRLYGRGVFHGNQTY